MAPGRKLGGGCWTCRLRRKRCDSIRPVCGSCQGLEITCHSGEARPSWMDGGTAQMLMSETIKESIKQNALLRRERRLFAHENQDLVIAAEGHRVSPTDSASTPSSRATGRAAVLTVEYGPPIDSVAYTLSTNTVPPTTLPSPIAWSEGANAPSATPPSTSGLGIPIQADLGSVMIYLDYVFPFLFPFYQPPLLETGRQWLLGLLYQNEGSLHIAASLSAYFFSLVTQNDEQGIEIEDDCKALVRSRLLEQMDMALTSIRSTVSATSHHGSLLDRIRIMEEITQLLIVEVTVRSNSDWTIHLNPACAIFHEIFQNHGVDRSEPSLTVLLGRLALPLPTGPQHHKPLPNTPDQSALTFFVPLLLFVDIVASTCLRTPPVLHIYHHSLLSSNNEDNCDILFEAIVGCRNWALVAVGNISALCAWKHDAEQRGTFSVVSLVNLAVPISQALEEGLTNLDLGSIVAQKKKGGANWLEAYYGRHDKAIDHTSIANVTRVWAHAAKIYLSVTLSGWQTNSTDIQVNVAKVLSLLQTIESPAQLRNLAWPICIAGCLALPSQEHDFHGIITAMGALSEFGTLYTALSIMQAVWNSRDTLDRNAWDIASSLSVLGAPALLL